jgi:hypothetical protein
LIDDAELAVALHCYFGLAEVSGEDIGLHIFWQLPPDFPDPATVEVRPAGCGSGTRGCDVDTILTLMRGRFLDR